MQLITQKPQCQWPPEQIAGWLKRRYPADQPNRLAAVTGMRANDEFYLLGRLPRDKR